MRAECDHPLSSKAPARCGGGVDTYPFRTTDVKAKEGLDRYAERVAALPEGDFRAGLEEILAGIRAYHARSLALLEAQGADAQS